MLLLKTECYRVMSFVSKDYKYTRVKIIIKVRYFMANFGGKISYLGVNTAAASATGKYSWGKWEMG